MVFPPTPEELIDWDKVTAAFGQFPAPKLDFDYEGNFDRSLWVFRGHRKLNYSLQPSIERVAERQPDAWARLEHQVLSEFRARAQMLFDRSELPTGTDLLDWLVLMQHYGVPTRLLDFTQSPYVALYFAIHSRSYHERREPAAVWAIDASALLGRAEVIAREGARRGPGSHRVSGVDFQTDLDQLRKDQKFWRTAIEGALTANGAQRATYSQHGFVAFAFPPVQNRRSSSQQGGFLLNGAEGITFEDSLSKMMDGYNHEWCKRFSIPESATEEFERILFRMNIHDLSLFPGMQGLAGFIKQKVRFEWLP